MKRRPSKRASRVWNDAVAGVAIEQIHAFQGLTEPARTLAVFGPEPPSSALLGWRRMSMRVRFAPSPTGYLHVGGGRTALFNWLWARKHGGTYVLRIEDTDRERSNDANTKSILDGLAWLGLDHDEGPYFQSEGIDRHVAVARQLLAEGKAYRSFLTPEELEAQRKQAESEKRTWLRDEEGRDRSRRGVARALADAGEPFAIRFRCPRGGRALRRRGLRRAAAQPPRHRGLRAAAPGRHAALQPRGRLRRRAHARSRTSSAGRTTCRTRTSRSCCTRRWGSTPPKLRAPAAHQRARPHEALASASTGRSSRSRPIATAGSCPRPSATSWRCSAGRPATTARSTRPTDLIQAFTLEGIGRSNAILTFSETDPRLWTDRKALFMNQQYISRHAAARTCCRWSRRS